MADISISRRQSAHDCPKGGRPDWLALAAAPTFALMALMTIACGGGEPDWLCAAAQGASPLNGMVPMYLLMSAFHAGPWLKVISGRRSEARRPCGSARSRDDKCARAGAVGEGCRTPPATVRGDAA